MKNIETGEYYAMKEIEKRRFKGNEDKLLNEVKKTRNTILINEIINNEDFLYIIMDLCE